jgi:hypothetical protein
VPCFGDWKKVGGLQAAEGGMLLGSIEGLPVDRGLDIREGFIRIAVTPKLWVRRCLAPGYTVGSDRKAVHSVTPLPDKNVIVMKLVPSSSQAPSYSTAPLTLSLLVNVVRPLQSYAASSC